MKVKGTINTGFYAGVRFELGAGPQRLEQGLGACPSVSI